MVNPHAMSGPAKAMMMVPPAGAAGPGNPMFGGMPGPCPGPVNVSVSLPTGAAFAKSSYSSASAQSNDDAAALAKHSKAGSLVAPGKFGGMPAVPAAEAEQAFSSKSGPPVKAPPAQDGLENMLALSGKAGAPDNALAAKVKSAAFMGCGGCKGGGGKDGSSSGGKGAFDSFGKGGFCQAGPEANQPFGFNAGVAMKAPPSDGGGKGGAFNAKGGCMDAGRGMTADAGKGGFDGAKAAEEPNRSEAPAGVRSVFGRKVFQPTPADKPSTDAEKDGLLAGGACGNNPYGCEATGKGGFGKGNKGFPGAGCQTYEGKNGGKGFGDAGKMQRYDHSNQNASWQYGMADVKAQWGGDSWKAHGQEAAMRGDGGHMRGGKFGHKGDAHKGHVGKKGYSK